MPDCTVHKMSKMNTMVRYYKILVDILSVPGNLDYEFWLKVHFSMQISQFWNSSIPTSKLNHPIFNAEVTQTPSQQPPTSNSFLLITCSHTRRVWWQWEAVAWRRWILDQDGLADTLTPYSLNLIPSEFWLWSLAWVAWLAYLINQILV